MREQIQNATMVLVGKTLWKCTRAADMACFQFGQHRKVQDPKGNEIEVGEFTLHVECSWRIIEKDRILVGRQDLYYPANYDEERPYPDDFDWERDPNRHDMQLDLLFESGAREFLVDQVDVGSAGRFQIGLRGGFSLEVFPSDSLDQEHWRLFEPRMNKPHFVVSGHGIGD